MGMAGAAKLDRLRKERWKLVESHLASHLDLQSQSGIGSRSTVQLERLQGVGDQARVQLTSAAHKVENVRRHNQRHFQVPHSHIFTQPHPNAQLDQCACVRACVLARWRRRASAVVD